MADPRFDVTSIGEMMLRLSVPSGKRLETATQLDVYPAGAEANVITLLSRLERHTLWAGALPQNPLGRLAANHLRSAGVDTNGIIWKKDGRLGTYYVEFAPPPRGIQVTYDRADSCMSQLQLNELNWDLILDTRLLHLTGITPAISESCLEIVKTAIAKAKERQIPISFDVNYRSRLWSEEQAGQIITSLFQNVELLFCSQADAQRLFGCNGPAEEIAQTLMEKSHAKYVVLTIGEKGAIIWDGLNWLREDSKPTQIIDRLGAGDALAAGVIHGWLNHDLASGLRDGTTLAALALSQFGDMVVTNREELIRRSQKDSTLER